ncbi:hypothetical protein BKA93DRAFT_735708 [Sparassis latifolia]
MGSSSRVDTIGVTATELEDGITQTPGLDESARVNDTHIARLEECKGKGLSIFRIGPPRGVPRTDRSFEPSKRSKLSKFDVERHSRSSESSKFAGRSIVPFANTDSAHGDLVKDEDVGRRTEKRAATAAPAPVSGQATSAKRPRVGFESPLYSLSTSGSAVRHPDFWLRDGSVVIRVGSFLFKLHRSRLEQESKFFAYLFSNARSVQKTIDGCPLYEIHVLSSSDFAVLLKAMDGGITYALNPPPFHTLAMLLRAAHTLQCTKFTTYATNVLRTTWPSDLASLTPERTPYAAETITLARKCAVPEVLKRAYYELLRTPNFGQAHDDEDDVSPLGVQDYSRLTTVREKLQAEWMQIVSAPPDHSHSQLASWAEREALKSRRHCEQAHANGAEMWVQAVVQKPVFTEGLLDPLCALQTLVDIDWSALGYCEHCVDRWRTAWRKRRERIWTDLDVWLGLS